MPHEPKRGAARYMKVAERHCADIARREAKNFYWGFLALPREKRFAIYALYDFARQVDDEVDQGGPGTSLAAQRERLRACLAGDRGDPIMVVLGQAIERYGIPGTELEALIDGVEMDLTTLRYASWAELERYCHLVAGVVGRMCVRIFGFTDGAALELADLLGQAMQLTNILRDVTEDAGMGRVYLPAEEMGRFGVSEAALLEGRQEPGWDAFVRFEAARARALFAAGLEVCDLIPPSSAVCVRIMAGLYRRILDEIEEEPERPLRERVSLSNRTKLRVALGSWLQRV